MGIRILALGAGLFLFALIPVKAAEFTLPRLEMASRSWINDGDFILSSYISADLALSGGYKYNFLLGFSLEAPDITDLSNNQGLLGFRVAKATTRDIFGIPLEMSYFIGSGDVFCSGEELSSRFGMAPIATNFGGYFYFPEALSSSTIPRYDGIHGVRGTGFSFALTRWDFIIPMLYLYQDFPFFSGTNYNNNSFGGNGEILYSTDLRLLVHYEWLSLEFFSGLSLKSSLDASIRGGLMAHLKGDGVELFLQSGILGWAVGEDISIDNLFLLIEPRIYFRSVRMDFTFFYHPVTYLHEYNENEKGKANFNLKFLFGQSESGFAGGVETGGELKIYGPMEFKFYLSPLASFISDGLRWDFKFRVNPLKLTKPEELFDIFIGVRTAF